MDRRKFIKHSLSISGLSWVGTFVNSCNTEPGEMYSICQHTCIGCGECQEVCPDNAILQPEQIPFQINTVSCRVCGDCQEECVENAIKIVKYNYSINANCIGCGECVEICSQNSDALGFPGEEDFYVSGSCNSRHCGHMCMSACEHDAISIINGQASIDPDKCERCGQCVKACPRNAIVAPQVEIDKDICINCGDCYYECEENAIDRSEPENFHEPYIDSDLCISCGQCKPICEQNSIEGQVGTAQIDHDICTLCGECYEICQYGAVEKI